MFLRAMFLNFSLLSSLTTYAASTVTVPEALLYQGKPLDALCLFSVEDLTKPIDLKYCGLSANQDSKKSGENNKLISQGFIGYDYSVAATPSMREQGYSYYKPVATVDKAVVVQTLNNTGGTGDFSALNLVTREGDHLKVQVLKAGDRCNGGLVDVAKQGNQLNYSVQITPFDFLSLAKDNPYAVKAYDDLAACAVCCAGKAVFQRDLGADFSHETLQYVDVSLYLKDLQNASTQGHHQSCFNQLLARYGQKNQGKLDAKQLGLFVQEFNASCVKKVALG